jgi:hypothetical protein
MAEKTLNLRELNMQDRTLFNAAAEQRETVTVPGAPVTGLAGAEVPKFPGGGINFEVQTQDDPFSVSDDGSFDPTSIANDAREATNVDNVELPDVSGDFGKIKLVLIALLVVVSAGQLGRLFDISL